MKTRRRAAGMLLLCLFITALAMPAIAVDEEGDHEGSSSETIFKWINFFTVFGPAVYFGRRPLKAAFASLRREIRADIDQAQARKAEAEQRIADIESRLGRLEEESQQLRGTARMETAAQVDRIRATAERESERILAMAKAEIHSTRRAASLELRAHSAQLAIRLAEKNLRQRLTPNTQAALFDTFVSQLGKEA